MYAKGSRISRALSIPHPETGKPTIYWAAQVLTDDPVEVQVQREYDGVMRTLTNLIAPVMTKHPITGAIYARQRENLNFATVDRTDLEEGLDYVLAEDEKTKVFLTVNDLLRLKAVADATRAAERGIGTEAETLDA